MLLPFQYKRTKQDVHTHQLSKTARVSSNLKLTD